MAAASVSFVEVSVSSEPSPLSSLTPAALNWSEEGTPFSTQFGDVYFSKDDGLSETRHVFLHNNGLPERWKTHPRQLFVVGETGFGTGLNFLALWQAFRHWRAQGATTGAERLHFISFEKYPLSRADLSQALRHWPELAALAQELVANYPYATPGCHRLLLDEGSVVLDLWFGDVQQTLDQLWHPQSGGLVDAWFLDGFAPSKNPEMWSDHLFAGLARLARPGATLATFTCAGFVRRGLQAAGFTLQKVKGHGQKREMLAGIRDESRPLPGIGNPVFIRAAADPQAPIHLSGGGIAAATLALSLVRRGRQVVIWCADESAAHGASGNRQGALYPQLNGAQNSLSQWHALAFGFARRWYAPLLARHEIPHAWCGVLQLAHQPQSQRKLTRVGQAHFPEELVRPVRVDELTALAGVPLSHTPADVAALFYPQGGWLSPKALTQGILAEASASGLLQVHYRQEITALQREGSGWRLTINGQGGPLVRNLVLATGHRLSDFQPTRALPAFPIRGQVSHLPTQAPLDGLRTVLCSAGYLTPAGPEQTHCLGASYARGDSQLGYRQTEQEENLDKLRRSLPGEGWPATLSLGSEARVAVRCATRDHLPLVGPAPALGEAETWPAPSADGLMSPVPCHPGLWVLGALGSHGLSSAPLAAEMLACELCAEPLPLAFSQLEALHPARSWLRVARRQTADRKPAGRQPQKR